MSDEPTTNDNAGRYLTMCRGKLAFATAHRAYAIAARRSKVGKHGHPYKCRYCHHWHIGTSNENSWSSRRR